MFMMISPLLMPPMRRLHLMCGHRRGFQVPQAVHKLCGSCAFGVNTTS